VDTGVTREPGVRGRARTLRALHRPGDPLVLVNAWDVASALVVESAGHPAVATSSWAMAAAQGYPDGEQAPWPTVLGLLERMATALRVPLTADLEGGYAADTAGLAVHVTETVRAGIAGVNIEDSLPGTPRTLRPLVRQCDRLRAARAAADASGAPRPRGPAAQQEPAPRADDSHVTRGSTAVRART
jgi:2-methylisocitrate lyase-like PEP mutase family enzyme